MISHENGAGTWAGTGQSHSLRTGWAIAATVSPAARGTSVSGGAWRVNTPTRQTRYTSLVFNGPHPALERCDERARYQTRALMAARRAWASSAGCCCWRFGSAVAGVGLVYGVIWLRVQGLVPMAIYNAVLLRGWPDLLRILLPVLFGGFLLAYATFRLASSLTAPFRGGEQPLAETIFQYRRTSKRDAARGSWRLAAGPACQVCCAA